MEGNWRGMKHVSNIEGLTITITSMARVHVRGDTHTHTHTTTQRNMKCTWSQQLVSFLSLIGNDDENNVSHVGILWFAQITHRSPLEFSTLNTLLWYVIG